MDHCEGEDSKKPPEEEVPEVPLKTYQWEDVRRSRSKGGYPWTHLYKEIFDESVNPQDFTMDAMRKNKTSTTSSASDSLDIKEITEDDVKGLENIDSSYVVIEGPILLGGQIDDTKDHEGVIESADSSDNISQYLDKEERGPEQLESTETLTLPGPSTPEIIAEEQPLERAKSEEPKRKRKLSVDSNYSRISLSRLGLMKRLKEAKDKIKLPKLGKNEKKDTKIEVEVPKKQHIVKVDKNVKPVYIHIPLKPPEGETDEFSYLEFEEKPLEIPPDTPPPPQQTPEVQIEEIEDDNSENEDEKEAKSSNTLGLDVPNDQEDDVSAIIFLEGDDEDDTKGEYDIMVVDIDEKSQEMTMSHVTNTEVKRQVLESIKRVESQEFKGDQDSGCNLSRTSSRTSRTSQKRRAKSVEPEKKRRSSIDSSKSLSKIGLLKKLKQHLPFKKSQSKTSLPETTTPTQPETPKLPKNQKPVYIHIPLKPPDGETDEFTHLQHENETKNAPEPEPNENQDLPEVESPEIQHPQFIFLTPPSDDEQLDKPDIPETPSSETGSLFQFGELKQIAKKAVDQVQGALDAVDEELETSKMEDKVLIDEEDGLKCTQKSDDTQTAALKSNLKDGASPLPKKKVSFKRRKSSQAKDDGYEEIGTPSDEKKEENVKMPPNVSLEEVEHNRWSKLSDHEYEPVNPPPDDKPEIITPPKSHVSDVLASSSAQSETNELNLTAQEMQTEIENRFFTPKTTTTITIKEEVKSSIPRSKSRSRSREKEPPKSNKFQTAIKDSATKFKSKLQGIKKPNITLPARPKFQKPNINIKKPNITLPKLPDFTSTFRKSSKDEDRKVVQEGASDDGQKQGIFDFSTYPRLFKKKKREYDSGSLKEKPEKKKEVIETHRWETSRSGPTQSIRIPLHSEASMDQENNIHPQMEEDQVQTVETVEETSPPRYLEDIEVDDHDVKQRERQEKHRAAIASFTQQLEDTRDNSQMQNGQEHHYDLEEGRQDLEPYEIERDEIQVTDLDQPELNVQPSAPTRNKAKLQQNDSIDTNHSREVGSSVSSLGQHRIGVLEEIDSDQFFLREKGISQDNIDMGRYLSTEIREAFRTPKNSLGDYNYDEMRTSNQSLPETKKKQAKKPKRRKTPHASQERLRYDQESENEDYNFMPPIRPRRRSKRKKKPEEDTGTIPYTETISIYQTDQTEYLGEPDDDLQRFYENHNAQPETMQDYKNVLHVHDVIQRRASEPIPAAPPRKHKSLKSLNASEHESMFDDYERDNDNNNQINGYQNEAFASSQLEQVPQPTKRPTKPPRSRSKTRSTSQCESIFDRTDSIMYDDENMVPVVEEPCIKDLRDAMGYAIVDKNQNKNWEHKFCTVPKSQGTHKTPERPLRNYSTLGPSRPPRKMSKNMTDEEKENVDITQYIEIEEQKDLQSGEVIQKMQNRPLPAPPRPPRCKSKPLSDITTRSNSEEHVEEPPEDSQETSVQNVEIIDETEVSTQTEPLPADFVCEEVTQEESDKVMTPSLMRKNKPEETEVKVETVLITPTHFTYEETITHGQLLVEPLNGAKILPESEITRIIPITTDEETSEIPETFNQLSDPPEQPQKPPRSRAGSMDVLKTQKIQVSDLDVDRLTVNELVANKIIVSEIDSGKITSQDIQTQGGALKLGNIELEPGAVEELLKKLQESTRQQSIIEEETVDLDDNDEQKKTPIDFRVLEPSISQDSAATLGLSEENWPEEQVENKIENDDANQPPVRPPRNGEKKLEVERLEMWEPEVDDEPPPRPPQPQVPYIPSQPPASFYALRAQHYVEGDVPSVPRKKRHHRPKNVCTSSSESGDVPVPRRRMRAPEEPSIPLLTCQLVGACSVVFRNTIKRLIDQINVKLATQQDGDAENNRQNVQVIIVILLVLIAGLLLLGYGEGRTVHLHHWEYFNPPKDI